jgi:flagellar basal body-associated protein FliL
MTMSLPRTMALITSSFVLIASSILLFKSFQLASESDRIEQMVERGPAHSVAHPAPKATAPIAIMEFDEIIGDLTPAKDRKNHALNVKLELELFDEENRPMVEKTAGALKDVILDVIQHQSPENLGTLSGKLYFKEILVSRMNTLLNYPVVRDIHFASFLIR